MPWGLRRFYDTGGLHFITWSCRDRQPFLGTPGRRDLLLRVVEQMRNRYRFGVVGYVVMPEQVHLLISEPLIGKASSVICAVKLGFARRLLSESPHFWQARPEVGHPVRVEHPRDAERACAEKHVWMKRFYDFNVWSQLKEVEKLKYMHRNPVVRRLVERPEDWEWSSFNAHARGEVGIVRINDWSWWEEKIHRIPTSGKTSQKWGTRTSSTRF